MNPESLSLFPDPSPGARASRPRIREASDTEMVSRRGEQDDTVSTLSALSPQYLALPSLLFTGDAHAMSYYALSCATQWLLQEGALLRIIDAGNAFNPYVIARRAQRAGVPAEDWLRRVYVARAFTPYQTVTLLEGVSRETKDNTQGRRESYPPGSVREEKEAEDGGAALHETRGGHREEGSTDREFLLVLLPFDGLEDSGFSGRERVHLARKILGYLRVLAAGRSERLWVVERHPAPLLEPFFRALSAVFLRQVCGEWCDGNRFRLSTQCRAQTLPAPRLPGGPLRPIPSRTRQADQTAFIVGRGSAPALQGDG